MCNFTNQVSPFLVFIYALRSLLTVCQIPCLKRLMIYFIFFKAEKMIMEIEGSYLWR